MLAAEVLAVGGMPLAECYVAVAQRCIVDEEQTAAQQENGQQLNNRTAMSSRRALKYQFAHARHS